MADFSISEWLQKAKEDPKQGAVPLVFVAGIAFVVWKFLYSPKTVLINKELKKIKGLDAEMNKFKNAANQLEDIKIDIEEKKAQWANTQKLCYKELERTQFLRRVRELANMSGMKVKSVNPLPDETIKVGILDAKKFSVDFVYSGDLTKILTFMRYIELEPKICFMPVPSLMPNASGTFDTTLTVSTILLPDVITTNMDEAENEEEEEE